MRGNWSGCYRKRNINFLKTIFLDSVLLDFFDDPFKYLNSLLLVFILSYI